MIEAADLAPGAHVNLVGFKQRGRAEFGLDLLARAALLATDSPAQALAYEPPLLACGTPYEGALRYAGRRSRPARRPGAARRRRSPCSCPVGLAGTEVFLLDRLAASADGRLR